MLGVVAAVAVYVALADRGDVVLVAMADRQIPLAGPVTDDAVTWVEVPAGSAVVDGLVDRTHLASAEWVTARPVRAGEPLTVEALVGVGDVDGERSMSIPLPRERAVGGTLGPGDRVDVIDVTEEGEAAWVVTDAEVLAVGGEVSGSVNEAPQEFHLVLAVSDDEALRLAAATADGEVDVVRSTGAPPAQASTAVVPQDTSDADEDEG